MRAIRALTLIAALTCAAVEVRAAPGSTIDSLREQFPSSSIDSTARADAALGATHGAKLRIDKEYKVDARECLGKILVNDCLDRLRELRRKRFADIDAVELDANRFKRKERSDRIEADRERREADHASKAAADTETRTLNREAFESRQKEAAKAVADRTRSNAIRAASPNTRKPMNKVPPAGNAQADTSQRDRNAVDYQKKLATAATHQQQIERRIVEKDADRKHRQDAKAVKDAKVAAAAAAAATAATQSPFTSLSGSKP